MSDLDRDPQARALAAALGSQYELVRLLGRGGMGAVYLAREPFLDRAVAVKVLPAELASGEARERFLREARTAARLSHPNIVPLYTFGQSGDLLYYLMGYVEGESLEARLKRTGRLDAEESRRILSELASALDYAHSMGVVHRDVKPDNVLIDRHTGRAMLTDFGIAKQRASGATLTQIGTVVGTPHYMSPEQASGDRNVDGRSDLYSLGVIGYRLLTGRLPFEGDDARDVLMQHAIRPPMAPSTIVSGLPLELELVVTRSLAKDPSARWQNGRSIADALTGSDDEATPDQLRMIKGAGLRLIGMCLGLMEVGILSDLFGAFKHPTHGPDNWTTKVPFGSLLAIPLMMFVIGVGSLQLIAPVRAFGWRASLQAWFLQPAWWKSWWPRFARRRGDVWDRLPVGVRRMRNLNLVNVVLLPLFVNALIYLLRPSFLESAEGARLFHSPVTTWGGVGFYAILLGTMGFSFYQYRKIVKPFGLTRMDSNRLLIESTFNQTFWSRPEIAAVLDGARRFATPTTQTPRELASDIERIANAESASPFAAVYRECVDGAKSMLSAIAHVDSELAQLARDANPAERQRIAASLEALGPAGADERGPKRQMRELLQQQMQLFAQLEHRQADLGARRDHLVEQLRTLALQAASLRAQASANTQTASEITGKIRSICRSIDNHIEASREADSIVATPSEGTISRAV